jgi:hypothetical protein
MNPSFASVDSLERHCKVPAKWSKG